MPKMSGFVEVREKLKPILLPIFLLICVVAVFAAVIFGYAGFQYGNEWKYEQKDFEDLCANVNYEKSKLASTASSAKIYQSKYTLSSEDVYGIIEGFLNKTVLTVSSYTFTWVKSKTFLRMYEHALMLDDDTTLKFNKPSTKILDVVFRSVLPIFSTFATGCSVSAIHSIVTNVIRLFIRHKRYEAWTVGRNRMLRANVVCGMFVALAYFAFCFAFSSFAISRWQKVSFVDGVKVVLTMIATFPPNVRVTTVTEAHTFAAFHFFVNTAVSYVVLSLVLLIKTWRISAFAIPLISDIDVANQVDKEVQKKYREKRATWFQNAAKTE